MPVRLRPLPLIVFAVLAAFAPSVAASAPGTSVRFHAFGNNDVDRVKIQIDDPTTTTPGPQADVGATDFTIEMWLRAEPGTNTTATVSCGFNINWINGNIVLDRDRFNQDRKFGFSLAGGRPVFGVSGNGTGDRTVCGSSDLRDGAWHHVALQRRRSDGRMWVYVDGALEGEADGPNGDVSYPDDGVPGNYCGGPCDWSDPYLVVGAEKHDAGAAYPSFDGWIDELRLSTVLRYGGDFTPAAQPFIPDGDTAALYHFDEGTGNVVGDATGGGSDGERRFGGSPVPGPEWSTLSPFGSAPVMCGGRLTTKVGTPGKDVLIGGPGVDVIAGLGGNDVIRGGLGDDVLCGGRGADILIGGGGADAIRGGLGRDRAEFGGSPRRVIVSLNKGSAIGWGGDTLVSIENVLGSAFDDTLRGSEADNVLTGGEGADRLFGFRGDDVLRGGPGPDTLDGGPGIDTCFNGSSVSCE